MRLRQRGETYVTVDEAVSFILEARAAESHRQAVAERLAVTSAQRELAPVAEEQLPHSARAMVLLLPCRIARLTAELRSDDRLSADWTARHAVADMRREQWGHGLVASVPRSGGAWRACLGASGTEAATYPPCSPADSGGAVPRDMSSPTLRQLASGGASGVACSHGKLRKETHIKKKGLRQGERLGSPPLPRSRR